MHAWGRRAAVMFVMVALAACTAGGEDGGQPVSGVKLGLVAPLSGPNQTAGRDMQQGAELAVTLINEQRGDVPLPLAESRGLPGLGGATLSLVTADTGSDEGVGATQTARLISEEGVAAIVGAYDVDVTDAASLSAERLTTPFVNGDTSATHLTERGLNWFFRVGPTDRMLGEALFSVLVAQEAAGADTRRIAILHPNDRRAVELATAVDGLAAEGGYDVVATVPFRAGAVDLEGPVDDVGDAEPDVVFLVATTSADAQRMVNAFGQADVEPDGLMGIGPGFAAPAFPGEAGAGAAGMFRSVAWSQELAARNPAAQAVSNLYQETYNVPMSETAAGSFMAVLTLAQGIDASGTVDAEQVRTTLTVLNEPGRGTIMPWDGVEFDATHQNVAAAATVEQFRGGQPVLVFPGEIAEVTATWPFTEARS